MSALTREFMICRVYFAMYALAKNLNFKCKVCSEKLVDRDENYASNERADVHRRTKAQRASMHRTENPLTC